MVCVILATIAEPLRIEGICHRLGFDLGFGLQPLILRSPNHSVGKEDKHGRWKEQVD